MLHHLLTCPGARASRLDGGFAKRRAACGPDISMVGDPGVPLRGVELMDVIGKKGIVQNRDCFEVVVVVWRQEVKHLTT